MNRVYGVIWSTAAGGWHVVSELAGTGRAGGRLKLMNVRAERVGQPAAAACSESLWSALKGLSMALIAAGCLSAPTMSHAASGGGEGNFGGGTGGSGNGGGGGAGISGDTGSASSDGTGGDGETYIYAPPGTAGAGGAGGAAGASSTGNSPITGQAGGAGSGVGGAGDYDGGGGGGGAGVFSTTASASLSNATTITGGAGGAGGSGAGEYNGGGGGGGVGLSMVGGSLTNSGTITGGAGGQGGVGGSVGGGGGGGDGVDVTGTASTVVTNTGTIAGGAGGGSGGGEQGAGGEGIVGASLSITNSGTIAGGTGLGGIANAIEFTGGVNTLTLETGSTLAGNVAIDAGSVLFNQSTAQTLSNVITGSGSVIVGGTGALTLTGSSTYTGGTTIDGGTLRLGDGTTGGQIVGAVVDNGSLVFDESQSASTFGGAISGSGSVTQAGTQTLTLSGNNSYSGGTQLQSGTIAVLSSTALGTGQVAMADGTGLTFGVTGLSVANDFSLSGVSTWTVATGDTASVTGTLSSSGGVTLAGGGTLALAGENTYTGATTIGAGTLALRGAGSIAQSSGVVDNGTFDISATTAGASIATLSGAGAVQLGARTLTLTQASGSFDGAISGTGGLTVSGGTQTLAGASSYSGTTTISSGATLTLSGQGSIAQSSTVADDGVLDISATTAGAVLSNLSGTGNVNVGTRTLILEDASGVFSGSFTGSGKLIKQGAGTFILDGDSSAYTGTTEVSAGLLEVGDADNAQAVLGGDVDVESDATLRGHGTILGDVSNDGTVAPGGSIGTLTIGGNYTQTATATLAIEVSPSAASQLRVNGGATLNGVLAITYDPGTYTSTQYTLLTAGKGVSGQFSSTTSTLASGATLGSLESSLTYGVNDVVLTLASAAPTTVNVTVVAPTDTSIYAAVGTATVMNAQGVTSALMDRLDARPAGASGRNASGWAVATGAQTDVDGTDGRPGFQANQYGFLAGFDRSVDNDLIGVAGGYQHIDLSEQATGDSGTVDALRGLIYARRWLGPVSLAGTLGYGLDFMSQKRPFVGIGTASGDHIGQEFTGAAQAGLPMSLAGFVLTPRIGLRYAWLHVNGFDESGAGGQDLKVGTDNVRSLQPYAEVALKRAFGDAFRPVDVQVRVGYAREVLDGGRAISVSSQDGTLFTAAGTSLPRGYLTAGIGIGMKPTKNCTVSLDYNALINTDHSSAQGGSVKVDWLF
ncbi:autotransporter domain-containing protein [Paraburkholderia tropica]|uniref:autotransporter domain-containing protein n=1 Tax=Paraburkholderia tropica TaxID=92647 RepID=UPI002AAF57CD|nr:autotransporter domain-containing protein [Paraburkholderia tropica]